MNWHYAYTPHIWPSVLTVLLLITLSVYSWRRRNVPGALVFAIYCLLGVPLLVCKTIGYLVVDFETKVFWFRVENIWWLPVATALTCFILEYAWPQRWLTRRNLLLLFLAPLLVLALILTNDFHHLLIRGYGFNGSVVPLYGPAGWVVVAYAFGLMIVNIIALVWLFIHSQGHRLPAALILIAQTMVRLLVLVDPFIQDSWFFYVPEMALTVVACAIAFFGFRLFDPILLARQTVIEQMQEGILALDIQGRVASINPAAERTLGMPASRAKEQSIKNLLPVYPDGHPAEPGNSKIEFSLGKEPGIRDYTLEISQMKDWRGLEVGRLLLLRDVTEPKRARELQKQHQLLLAVMQERERLARELHDSLGQTLAAAHLQASTARVFLAGGETAQADKCLEQMAEITLAAEADVREYLLGAKVAFSSDHSFFQALMEYTARFSRQYGLQVELSVPPQLEERGLGQEIELQFMRIIQEALSNVRKHARAKNVQVIFKDAGQWVRIVVTDDGQGFDPAAVAARQAGGFGLQSMRERVKSLGGSLEVISQPGQGTKLIVHAPLQKVEGYGETLK